MNIHQLKRSHILMNIHYLKTFSDTHEYSLSETFSDTHEYSLSKNILWYVDVIIIIRTESNWYMNFSTSKIVQLWMYIVTF